MKILILVVAGLIAALMLYVRFAPIGDTHFAKRSMDVDLGEESKLGGYRVVLGRVDAPAQERLFTKILATPRTSEITTDLPNTRIFVTRSAFWGFPDVTQVTTVDETLILDGHLVYGRSDLGVNKARIKGWLNGLL